MTAGSGPRTLLEALIRQQQLTWAEAARIVQQAAQKHEQRTISISARHLDRLARRERTVNPNPSTSRALQHAFGHSIVDLLSPPRTTKDAAALPSHPERVTADRDTEREVLTMAADRAQRFALNLPSMADLTMDQISDGVRDLARAYPVRPLPEILGHLVAAQETIFTLLERPQRPTHGRQLYFLAGVICGMLAKASHDTGDPTAALAQARTAYLCAEQADHHGLRAWITGLQSMFSYWAGRPHEAIRYAQRGTEFAQRARSTCMVWLPMNEARAWGRLGNATQSREAIQRAEDGWNSIHFDELDELGGLATFTRSRQLYYAADTLAWIPAEAEVAEEFALQAVQAYVDRDAPDWAFGDQAGSHADLAIARIFRGELEGATEALSPVLELPIEQRIGGVIKSAQRVHDALVASPFATDSRDLQEQIEIFARTPVQLSR